MPINFAPNSGFGQHPAHWAKIVIKSTHTLCAGHNVAEQNESIVASVVSSSVRAYSGRLEHTFVVFMVQCIKSMLTATEPCTRHARFIFYLGAPR